MQKQEVDNEREDSGINSGSSAQSSPDSSNIIIPDAINTSYNSQNPQFYKTPTSPAQSALVPQENENHHESNPTETQKTNSALENLKTATENVAVHFRSPVPHLSKPLNDDTSVETPPKTNSHSKIKTFKCKQCDFLANEKVDFWDHMKTKHIRPEKLLACPKCRFVTEYKHHLEYHLNNHTGAKPFKCDQCSYTCVNKSMLNSHMKSHSDIYQYRCANCSYCTKYCHSLKVHLRKYRHEPAMVLNPDGTPNPLPIIDVYGTRRGPRNSQTSPPSMSAMASVPRLEDIPSTSRQEPNLLQQMMLAGQHRVPFPLGLAPFPFLQDHRVFWAALQRQAALANESVDMVINNNDDDGVLDLSKPENERSNPSLSSPSESSDDDDDNTVTGDASASDGDHRNQSEDEDARNNNRHPGNYICPFCTIAFGDIVLYTIHMGYHGFKDPFTCNMCGEECGDKVSFFLHIARTPHN